MTGVSGLLQKPRRPIDLRSKPINVRTNSEPWNYPFHLPRVGCPRVGGDFKIGGISCHGCDLATLHISGLRRGSRVIRRLLNTPECMGLETCVGPWRSFSRLCVSTMCLSPSIAIDFLHNLTIARQSMTRWQPACYTSQISTWLDVVMTYLVPIRYSQCPVMYESSCPVCLSVPFH